MILNMSSTSLKDLSLTKETKLETPIKKIEVEKPDVTFPLITSAIGTALFTRSTTYLNLSSDQQFISLVLIIIIIFYLIQNIKNGSVKN